MPPVATLRLASHLLSAPTLIATCIATLFLAIGALPALAVPPVCDPGGPYVAEVGVPIQLNGTRSFDPDGFITEYYWQCGDGHTELGAAPTHTYTTPGTLTVRLTVTDNSGLASQCQTTVMVGAGSPTCDAGGPYFGVVNGAIHFDGTDSFDPNGVIVDYRWAFGDGAMGNGPTVTHAYSTINDFSVQLCVEDAQGIVSCCLTTAHVREATLGLTPVIGVSPQTLDFGCTEVGVPIERTIAVFNNVLDPSSLLHLTDAELTAADFELVGGPTLPVDIPGDGSDVTFTFRFTPPDPELTVGMFTLTAPNAANSPVEVFIRGRGNAIPSCDPGGPYSGQTGDHILFDGSGSSDPGGITLTYHWDFGDGTTGTGVSPTHRYTIPGTFQIVLSLTDDCGAASACTTSAVVAPALFCDAGGPYFGANNIPVQFNGTGSGDPGGFIVAYNWDFGDGSTGTGPTPVHTYTLPGSYTVELEVIDNDNNSASCTTVANITIIQPVEISAFQAAPRPDAVDVSWRFRSDGDFLGFELRRQQGKAEPELALHDGLLTDDDQNGAITFTDTRVQPGASYDYWLVAVERNGDQERFGPLQVDVPLPALALRIAPNPSRPPISLALDLPHAGPVKLWVADATGRLVQTLAEGQRPAGRHPLRWDGRDGRGIAVASGIYFTILEQAGEVRKEKLVLVR